MATQVTRLRKTGNSSAVVVTFQIRFLHRGISRSRYKWSKPVTISDDSYYPACYAWKKKIEYLIRTDRLQAARSVFDRMKHRNLSTWNAIIIGYVRCKQISEARKLFEEMPQKNILSWNLMISGYASCHGGAFLQEARLLFDRMPERDYVSWNTMIYGYAKCGLMAHSLWLFDTMVHHNIVTWNVMVSGFLLNGDTVKAVEWFKKMPERDKDSLNCLVLGLVRNGEIDRAMEIVVELGKENYSMEGLVRAYNTLIAGYGCMGRVSEARRLFDQIPDGHGYKDEDTWRFVKDAVSWNSMIMCYVKAKDLVSARTLFDKMIIRDNVSWNTMISGYVRNSDMGEASHLFLKMQDPDSVAWNSMISGHAQVGDMKLAKYFCDRMPNKTVITWNSLIAGYKENLDPKGALKVFTRLQVKGPRPDQYTLSLILGICADMADLYFGMQVHLLVEKAVVVDTPINNSLITMYSRCGAIMEALKIFNSMKTHKTVISWNAVISGCAFHGFAGKALEHFMEMKRGNVQPNDITFVSVLHACAQAGLVEEGRRQFNSMVCEYGIQPKVDHYASLVDVLGRHGKLDEAIELIRNMPMKADSAVWSAFLSGCRLYGNLELCRVAVEALMELEPHSSRPYVSLYNMYSERGQWDDAERVRSLIDKNRMFKPSGHSRVGLKPED